MTKVRNLLQHNESMEKQSAYDAEKFRERVMEKYRPKSYDEANVETYLLAVRATYPLQLLMLLTGLTGLTKVVGMLVGYEFNLNTLTHPLAIVTIIVSVTLLFQLEKSKRKFSIQAFEKFFAMKLTAPFFAVGLLMAISIGLSFYGSVSIVKATSGGNIELIDIEAIHNYYSPLLAQSERNLDGFRNRKGEFYHKYSKQVAAEQALLTDLRKEYNSKLNAAETNNQGMTTEDQNNTQQKAYMMGYISLFCELMFLLCIYYKEHHEFRCSIEFGVDTTDYPKTKTNSISYKKPYSS
ncbi:MAG: hypothetical protein AAF806_30955, partial [Bacteroidota bacterium]